jgi:radical SAM superfamily enzyme YgiQ (UPF0313 family)
MPGAAVYLADLRHNYTGILSNDCMPLGVSYLKAVMDRDLPQVDSRLFAYPDVLLDAMRDEPPDVLMLANYMWNEQLSFLFARLMRQIRPETLVVMGGPNIALEPERQIAYIEAHPEIDLYALGEGDFLCRDLIQEFLDSGLDKQAFLNQELPSSVYRQPDGQVVRTEMPPRHKEIEEIPSPWLTGILDEFFDGKLAPLLETNRGCPFQCTFCVQATRWYAKVHNFAKDRVFEEVDYIGRMIHEKSPSMGFLRIADSNYGMYERDIEISERIGMAQKKYGWPTFIDATTGKNRPERVIKSLEKANGALVLYQAVQSLDERTLKNIKRSNIKLEAYEDLLVHMRGRGLRALSDLILGLPGETLESHIRGVGKMIDSGISELHLFQAMLLKGSPLETQESRAEFQFDARFRVLPKNFGIYGDEKVFDVDEIVVGTETMDFDAYLKARKYALASSIFWNNSWFEDAVQAAEAFGVKRSEWLLSIAETLQEVDGPIGELVDSFENETRNELFPSYEAVTEFYSQPENFERLEEGEIGDNLMYKYRAKAGFFMWPEIAEIAMDVTRQMLLARGAAEQVDDFERLWDDFHRYVEMKHTHGSSLDELLAPTTAVFQYDVPQWVAAGTPRDPSAFRLREPQSFLFEVPAEFAREIRDLIAVWSTSLKGLTKGITRIKSEVQTRECRPLETRLGEQGAVV